VSLPETTAPDARRLRVWQVRIFAALWAGYASYYLCRVNFAVAQPAILAEFPDWSSARLGAIPSVYAALYAVGQFVNGQLGERLGARAMMTGAIVVAGATNVLFAGAHDYTAMLVLWGLNGYAQSAGWPLLVQTISRWTPRARRGTVIGLISTCYQVGNVASWLLAGALCQRLGWRAAFWVPGVVLLGMSAAFVLGVRNRPEDAGFRAIDEPATGAGADPKGALPEAQPPLGAREVLRVTLGNRVLWTLASAYLCMNSVRYAFMNWSVQYLAQFHGRSIKGSAFLAVALPLIGAVGAVSSGWATDALFGKRRAPVCAAMLAGLAIVCVGFVLVPRGDWVLATVLLGAAGFLVFGPDMLMSGAAAVDWGHPRAAAAASGFTMAMGAAGAIFSGAGVGWLRDLAGGGWGTTFYTLAALSSVSAAMMTTLWNARPRTA
jgi:sugar phosphate permease